MKKSLFKLLKEYLENSQWYYFTINEDDGSKSIYKIHKKDGRMKRLNICHRDPEI